MLLSLGLVTLITADAGGFGERDAAVLTLGAGASLLAAWLLRPENVARGFAATPIALLFALAGLGLLSLIWTSAPAGDALATAMLPAAYGATGLAVLALSGDPGARRLVLPWIAGLSLVGALSGLVGVLAEAEPWGALLGGRWRAAGFVEYPPALAFLLLAGLPAWGSVVARARGAGRAGAAAALAALAVCLVLTGSRLGLAAAGLLLLMLLWHRRRSLGRQAVAVASIAALAAVVAAVLLSGSGAGPGEGRQGVQGADHGRLALWEDSLPAFDEAPLLGHGSASYYEATRADQEDPTLFAHNLPLESAVELGVPGLLLATALLAACAVAVWRRRGSLGAWLLGPAVVAFVAFGLTDWIWHLAGAGAVWAVLLGSLVRIPEAGPEPRDD